MFGGNFHDFFRGAHGHPGAGDDDEDDSQDYHNGNHHDGGKKEDDPDPNNDYYYKVLEVDKKADTAQIRKAFKQRSLKGDYRHPDRGGDAEKFKVLNEAYSVLQDPEKRDIYDQYGLKGLKQEQQGGGGGAGGFDIFDLLGGRGGPGGRRGQAKAKAKLVPFKCTLEEAYKGKSAKYPHQRKRTCAECDGKGGKNVKKCATCKGQGVVQRIVQQGFFQQIMQSACPNCKGEGQSCDKGDQCKTCKGDKIVDNKVQLDVVLEPGVYHDFDIKFAGEGDEAPGVQAGDVYLRVQIEEHKVFKRKGADLYIDKTITLLEALSGFQFTITHLDGSKLNVATAPGEIISHEQVKCVHKKGMPFFKDAFSYGNLYIKFSVEFPQRGQLTAQQTEALKSILPATKSLNPPAKKGQANVEYMEDFQEADLNPNPEGGHKRHGEHDEDEEHGHGGGRTVQCAQQ